MSKKKLTERVLFSIILPLIVSVIATLLIRKYQISYYRTNHCCDKRHNDRP